MADNHDAMDDQELDAVAGGAGKTRSRRVAPKALSKAQPKVQPTAQPAKPGPGKPKPGHKTS